MPYAIWQNSSHGMGHFLQRMSSDAFLIHNIWVSDLVIPMMPWHEIAFHITSSLWSESSILWWIPITKFYIRSPNFLWLLLITKNIFHDDVMKWKHFLCYWPFVWAIHQSLVNSPHKGQWCGALIFSVICAQINSWVNNHEAGDLRCHHAHYHVIVMYSSGFLMQNNERDFVRYCTRVTSWNES